MNSRSPQAFWKATAELAASRPVVVDPLKGKSHPSWPPTIHARGYGYLERSSTAEGGGINVWSGSLETRRLTGILCTLDTLKSNAEVKHLPGCTSKDVEAIMAFRHESMKALYISSPEE